MSSSVSPSTSKLYGIKRVCDAWGFSSSTYYRCQKNTRGNKKRGPRPKLNEVELIKAIRDDLDDSPFKGEGHRKVHARLRRKGLVVGRQRVLKLMRTEQLLSPHRAPSCPKKEHDKQIITEEPNKMWATDGTKIFTLNEGWVWLFTVVEHWNAECLGFHVTQRGNRFAALTPLSSALKKQFGSIERGVALGLELSLRMDNGSQYRSSDFLNQVKSWGMHPSFGFVREPETNGVVERFYRTLNEQVLSGGVFKDTDHVREEVSRFIETYNEKWLLEKLGYLSPLEARAQRRVENAA